MSAIPLISIIIPTYNRAYLLGETLDSVLVQTYTNWECIVVDDGSTDGTSELMNVYSAKDTRFKYHARPETYKPGGNGARNYGFSISKGEFIQWFDSDDLMDPNFLKIKISYFTPDTKLVISPGTLWNPITGEKKIGRLKLKTTLYQDFLCWRLGIFTPGILFRRSFLKGKELFDEQVIRGQETEFFLRLFYRLPNSSYKIIQESLFLYRRHVENKSTEDEEAYLMEHFENKFELYFNNYIKSLEINDKESIKFCYIRILGIFYSSLYHKDLKLSKKIKNSFFPLLRKNNPIKASEIIIMSTLCISFKKMPYRLIVRWKEFNLNFI